MMTAKTASDTAPNRRQDQELDRRYGRIGISAVAAALPYRGEKRDADAVPAETRKDRAA